MSDRRNVPEEPVPTCDEPLAGAPTGVGGLRCPACGLGNHSDAVFCASPACHKALGEFKYVLEELAAKAHVAEKIADRVTEFVGRPQFVAVHVVWFIVWILLNSGAIALFTVFDAYPYSLLGIVLAIEAILITSFLLISSNRQSTHSNKRAELDYEVNVRTYRHILQVTDRLRAIEERLDRLER
jgi:uncharacterized membrane protein